MAILGITEWANLVGGLNGGVAQAPLGPPVASQQLAVNSTSEVSGTFNSDTRLMRLAPDVNCYLKMSTAPVVTTTSGWYKPAYTVGLVGAKAGMKVAVIST